MNLILNKTVPFFRAKDDYTFCALLLQAGVRTTQQPHTAVTAGQCNRRQGAISRVGRAPRWCNGRLKLVHASGSKIRRISRLQP